jgi:hypothetical protein
MARKANARRKHDERISVSWGEMILFAKFMISQGEPSDKRTVSAYLEHKADNTALWFRFLAFKAMRGK